MTIPKRRGPKPKPDSRRYVVKVRLNAEEKKLIKVLCSRHGFNESELVRAAIERMR